MRVGWSFAKHTVVATPTLAAERPDEGDITDAAVMAPEFRAVEARGPSFGTNVLHLGRDGTGLQAARPYGA